MKKDVLGKFFSYCNSGDIEKVFELLSDNCKEEMHILIIFQWE